MLVCCGSVFVSFCVESVSLFLFYFRIVSLNIHVYFMHTKSTSMAARKLNIISSQPNLGTDSAILTSLGGEGLVNILAVISFMLSLFFTSLLLGFSLSPSHS